MRVTFSCFNFWNSTVPVFDFPAYTDSTGQGETICYMAKLKQPEISTPTTSGNGNGCGQNVLWLANGSAWKKNRIARRLAFYTDNTETDEVFGGTELNGLSGIYIA